LPIFLRRWGRLPAARTRELAYDYQNESDTVRISYSALADKDPSLEKDFEIALRHLQKSSSEA
jgi:hypothetical protein